MAAAPALRTRLQAAGPVPDEARLVVDLSRVTLLDAAAMGVLAQASRMYGEVVLRGASPVLRRVLTAGELTRVVRLA